MRPGLRSPILRRTEMEFVDSVVELGPKLATFDCDGTLWSGDAGEGFFAWELEQKVVPEPTARWARARFADYKAGLVEEDTMCGELVTLHKGLKESHIQALTDAWFDDNLAQNIFPVMQETIQRLMTSGCEVWAVSASNQWVIRSAMRHFGVPKERILSSEVVIKNGIITDRLVRVPSGEGKPRAIREVAGRPPDAAFGNSRFDVEMLKMAATPFAINPNPDLETVARQMGWTLYFPH